MAKHKKIILGGTKYTVRERNIARRIYYLLRLMRAAKKRYDHYDMLVNVLKNKLHGKYGR